MSGTPMSEELLDLKQRVDTLETRVDQNDNDIIKLDDDVKNLKL